MAGPLYPCLQGLATLNKSDFPASCCRFGSPDRPVGDGGQNRRAAKRAAEDKSEPRQGRPENKPAEAPQHPRGPHFPSQA